MFNSNDSTVGNAPTTSQFLARTSVIINEALPTSRAVDLKDEWQYILILAINDGDTSLRKGIQTSTQ